MTIAIDTREMLFRVRRLSHDEVEATVPDPEAAYHMEAGSEKEDTVKDCLNRAWASVTALLEPFIDCDDAVEDTEVAYGKVTLPDAYTIDLVTSERRLAGKEAMLTERISALLVDRTLGHFYTGNGQTELAQKWNALALADEEALVNAIHSKRPPKLHARHYGVQGI